MGCPTEVPEDEQSANPQHVRRDFYRLSLDFVHLKHTLENPPKQVLHRRSRRIEYGHPAEWASDKTAQITDMLTSWHDMLAAHRNETPPQAGHETKRVVAAWKYLEPRIEKLCELVTKADLSEIGDLHNEIRRTLQLDRQPAVWLNIECPVCEYRMVFRDMQRERLSCGNCGWTDTEDHKEFHVFRTLVDVVERHEPFLP